MGADGDIIVFLAAPSSKTIFLSFIFYQDLECSFLWSKITNVSAYKQIAVSKGDWARVVFIQMGGSVRMGAALYVVVGIGISVLGQFMLYISY